MAGPILFPWSVLGQRCRTNISLIIHTVMLVAVVMLSFVRLRVINSVRAGRPVPKRIIAEKIESLRISIKGATLSLNMAVRTKTGRTIAAAQSLSKIEACESFSSCLL